MSAESPGPVLPPPSPLAPARPSVSLPPLAFPTPPGQPSPVPPPPSGIPTLPPSGVPVLPTSMPPTLPVGTPAPASSTGPVAIATAGGAAPVLPAAPPTKPKNWKPIQRSKARKAVNGLIGIGVLAVLAGGAWFGYQSLAPAEDTTTPTTLLIDNPDTFIGQANAVVEQINEQAPDQELLDLAGVESPDAPSTPPPPTTTP